MSALASILVSRRRKLVDVRKCVWVSTCSNLGGINRIDRIPAPSRSTCQSITGEAGLQSRYVLEALSHKGRTEEDRTRLSPRLRARTGSDTPGMTFVVKLFATTTDVNQPETWDWVGDSFRHSRHEFEAPSAPKIASTPSTLLHARQVYLCSLGPTA